MNHPYPQHEQALRDMLIHKAEGTAHTAISKLIGLGRLAGWAEADWVNAIHVLGFGARGHPRSVFRFLEMALMRWHRARQVELNNLQPGRIYKGGGDPFTDDYLGRLVRVGGPVYDGSDLNPDMTGTLYAVTGTRDPGGDWVELVPIATSEQAAAPTAVEVQRRHARFLAFRIREVQTGPRISDNPATIESRTGTYVGAECLYEVLLDPTRFAQLPPTYLQDTGSPSASAPLGGHLTPGPSYNANRSRDGACWPLYLGNNRRLAQLEVTLEEILAAGVRVEIKLDRS